MERPDPVSTFRANPTPLRDIRRRQRRASIRIDRATSFLEGRYIQHDLFLFSQGPASERLSLCMNLHCPLPRAAISDSLYTAIHTRS